MMDPAGGKILLLVCTWYRSLMFHVVFSLQQSSYQTMSVSEKLPDAAVLLRLCLFCTLPYVILAVWFLLFFVCFDNELEFALGVLHLNLLDSFHCSCA